MGMDLSGKKRKFRFNWTPWCFVLRLAYNYGWQPKGTTVSELTLVILEVKDTSEDKWDGTYFANEFQEVGDEDALNIANALEKALSDIPNQENKDIQYLINHKDNAKIDPLQFWSGKRNKAYLKKFIIFCREGYFLIG